MTEVLERQDLIILCEVLAPIRGKPGSMITLVVAPDDHMDIIVQALSEKQDEVSKIENSDLRMCLMNNLADVKEILTYPIPSNGLIILSGRSEELEAVYAEKTFVFEPYRLVKKSKLYFDDRYHMEALNDLVGEPDPRRQRISRSYCIVL